MRRSLLRLAVTGILLSALAGAATAAVHVRVAVDPSTIPQCSAGHVFLALNNDGTTPILARVCFALSRNDTTLLGPLCGRVALAAGETRSHEFMFFVPPRLPVGNYKIVVHAKGSDGSSDDAAASFAVTASTPPTACQPGSLAPEQDLLNDVLQKSGVSPEVTTQSIQRSWGTLKSYYR